jgi:hypothetical protein
MFVINTSSPEVRQNLPGKWLKTKPYPLQEREPGQGGRRDLVTGQKDAITSQKAGNRKKVRLKSPQNRTEKLNAALISFFPMTFSTLFT